MLAANPAEERVQADFDLLPFPGGTFDAVVFTASLFLAPDPHRAVAEAARVLGDAGVVGAVAPIGWVDGDGEDVFAGLERDSRSPSEEGAVAGALEAEFDVESGVWSFPTTAAAFRAFHAIPAMAARLYPRLDTEARIERAAALLADVEGPLEQRWRWFVGR
jgi:cyclopropane-fatty-acyl-phospholipid synthase